MKRYHIVGLTHIDLAWLYDSHHYRLCQENLVVRLLDMLEHDSELTYSVEQIAHFRWLNETRPDLIERLRPYAVAGRIEVGGAMASGIDTNGPNGECYVRNHLLGRAWTREFLGTEPRVGSLIDTFGISAQTPQIHVQLGMPYLLANRVGRDKQEPLFRCEGLDGSTIIVAGPDSHSPNIRPGRVHFGSLDGRVARYDEMCDTAAASTTSGPHLVMPYDECEHVPYNRGRFQIDRRQKEGESAWEFSTMHAFFEDLEKTGVELPTVWGDLNPELTGFYGLRPFVRHQNRELETKLLEAEKWATLLKRGCVCEATEEAWWTLSYIQSHDIYSGGFPTIEVLPEVLRWLEDVDDRATRLLTNTLGPEMVTTNTTTASIAIYNGLPWARNDIATLALPEGWSGVGAVTQDGSPIPFETDGRTVSLMVEVPSVGMERVELLQGAPEEVTSEKPIEQGSIENEFIRVECSAATGIDRIILKRTGEVVAEKCGGLIVAQHDTGKFKQENPIGSEMTAASGTMRLRKPAPTECGRTLLLSGSFLPIDWAGPANKLDWELLLTLRPGEDRLDVAVRINWKGESSRVRLHLPTTVDSAHGLYEIPFGVVRRQAYTVRHNARGAWPVHRFALIEDSQKGVALINTGSIGAEVSGGSIRATLFRAPEGGDSTNMVADASMSVHGEHRYHFAIVPFSAPFSTSSVLRNAQEVNNPLLVRGTLETALAPGDSLLSLSPDACVLSAIKEPENGSGRTLVVRFYESSGEPNAARLRVKGLRRVWLSSLLEERGEPVDVDNELVEIPVRPFEIKTVLVEIE